MAPSTSPRHDRAGLRLWSPAFFAVAIIACGAMYGAGFGIGRVLDGSGSHHPSATVPRSIDQQAVSTLENGLGLMKSARGTLDEYVLPILPDAGQKSPCTKPSDVVDKINDAITRHRRVGPVILILPKWFALPVPKGAGVKSRDGWVALLGAAKPDWAEKIGKDKLLKLRLDEPKQGEKPA